VGYNTSMTRDKNFGRDAATAARNRKMHRMRAKGWSYADLAEYFSISTTRVRQIVADPNSGQRVEIRAQKPVKRAARPVASHGSEYSYKKHLKEGTEPCQPCRNAHAAAQRHYQRTRKTA
jgi:hypothetical protein